MAYTTCADVLSNIGVQCNEKTVAGFTGRGLLGIKSNAAATVTSDGDVLTVTDANMVLLDNVWANALDGTQTALALDNGRPMWHHDVAIRVPRVDALTARNNVKALAKNSLWAILEREDGSYLALGFNGKLTATAQTQAENAAAGDWQTTLGCDESIPETLFVDDPQTATSPKTAKEKFNTMWNTIVNAA